MKVKAKPKGKGKKKMATVAVMPEVVQMSKQDLSKKATALATRFGMWGINRKVPTSKIKVDADKAMIRVTKKLVDSKEYVAIRKKTAEVRQYIETQCLPFEVAIDLVPFGIATEVDAKMEEFKKEWLVLVDVFVKAYPELCKTAAKRLNKIHNPLDYPTAEEVRSKFVFKWKFVGFGVPGELKEYAPELWKKEEAKAKKSWSDAGDTVVLALRASFAELIEHLSDRLGDEKRKGKKKPKIFRDTAITKLNTFLESFERRNVMDDAELKTLVNKARQIVSNVSPEELRSTEGVRDRVRKALGKVSEELAGMTMQQPERMFRDEAELE